MSYCRWLEADIYTFATKLEGVNCIECCACPFAHFWDPEGTSFLGAGAVVPIEGETSFFYTYTEFLAHLDRHRGYGDYVPEEVYETIRAEMSLSADDPNRWVQN